MKRQPARIRCAALCSAASALILVLGGFYYWTHSGNTARAPRPRCRAGARRQPSTQRDMPVVEHTIGTVVANSTVSVTARVQGQLTKAFFKEGQMVKTGDLLFEIDPAPVSGRL